MADNSALPPEAMESSRVFVKGLPPTIDEAAFRAHFAYAGHITDLKLIPQRRIGYVGYRTPAEATKSVKRLNRSFIRMSKISVEPARPVAQSRDIASRAVQHKPLAATSPDARKRKRDALDGSDSKLQEYLGVMQPAKNSANKIHETGLPLPRPSDSSPIPAVDHDASDDEYEAVPAKKPRSLPQQEVNKNPNPDKARHQDALARHPSLDQPHVASDDPAQKEASSQAETSLPDPNSKPASEVAPPPAGTDDDWLRSRTNRLLDLVDDDDDPVPLPAPSARSQPEPSEESTGEDEPDPADGDLTNIRTQQGTETEILDEAEQDINDNKDTPLDTIHRSSRLFVRNLPYTSTELEVRAHFEDYGDIEEVHVPTSARDKNKGFAFVQFADPDAAVRAFQEADGHTFQGRILHIIPASAKREQLDEFALSKLPLKQQNLLRKKAKAATNKFNWNSLYMNQDAVVSSVSARLGVTKAELLDPHSSDAAVKQALAETSTIQDTKAYFAANGMDLNAFKSSERGDTAILVKNFEFGTSPDELKALFGEHGQVLRVLMPPAGTIAVVQFAQAPQAKAAFSKLAYKRFKNSMLFLEKAPRNLFVDGGQPQSLETTNASGVAVGLRKLSVSELLERAPVQEPTDTTSLHVKNLSFTTTTADLASAFRPLEGFRSARVNTKTDPKKPGQVLSMGFGFVEFSTKEAAGAAQSAMGGYTLHGHDLQVRASHRGRDAAEDRRRQDNAKKAAGHRTKLIIKNLPFEATKKDMRTLFGAHGQVRAVRVPKKFNHSARGYAFVDFTTPREAETAMNALQDTHLLGRRLVLQFAEAETVDPEEEIKKMQQKVGRQANKVALQQLTGGGRKRLNLGDDEEDGDI